jgi:hypothetical protein
MNCSKEECIGSILIVALGTAIATNYISLPPTLISHPITTVLLVLFGIGAFTKYPVLGIAIFLTTAIILFQRNMQTTRSVATYGIESIRRQAHETAEPSVAIASRPREYDQFQETDAHNPMHGPIYEGFEPAPYGDSELGENVEGAYPIGAARVETSGDSSEFMYRPDPDTGSNAFERFGPDMDEKKSFSY